MAKYIHRNSKNFFGEDKIFSRCLEEACFQAPRERNIFSKKNKKKQKIIGGGTRCLLEARRNVTSTIASQRTSSNTLGENRLGAPQGCHPRVFIINTGSPRMRAQRGPTAWSCVGGTYGPTTVEYIYSASASAKAELLAPSKARLGRRRHKWARGHAMRLVLPSPLTYRIQR